MPGLLARLRLSGGLDGVDSGPAPLCLRTSTSAPRHGRRPTRLHPAREGWAALPVAPPGQPSAVGQGGAGRTQSPFPARPSCAWRGLSREALVHLAPHMSPGGQRRVWVTPHPSSDQHRARQPPKCTERGKEDGVLCLGLCQEGRATHHTREAQLCPGSAPAHVMAQGGGWEAGSAAALASPRPRPPGWPFKPAPHR